tara:strand:- start:932 stop:1381 length:450 start_codon:yes stop_codon:yes gene_type:complete
MSKILTEDLILEKMFEKGIKEPRTLDVLEAKDIVCEYYDTSIIHDWNRYANMYFYSSSTADGYEVWVATEDQDKPYFDQDVYYYESQWFEKLPDCIRDGMTIHIDEYSMDDYAFEDAIEEVYETYWNDIKEEIENELIEEGYVWEEKKA